jgi:alkyl hydroperoxide reductase subunit AhpC
MSLTIGRPAPALFAPAWSRGADGPVDVELPVLGGEFRAAGAQVVAVSTDGYWTHSAWFETDPRLSGVRYPVIADTAHHVSRANGVLADDGVALRATIPIDPEGIVRHASVTDRSVGRRADEALRLLQAMNTGDLCPVDWQPGLPTLGIAA